MTDTIAPVSIRAAAKADPDEVTLLVKRTRIELKGWTAVRVTVGMERCPSDFFLEITDFNRPDFVDVEVVEGDECEVRIGADVVVTGYVDRFMPRISAGSHTITISGRGKCQDLVDCSAIWPNGQIIGSSALEIARKLAQPYGIEVSVEPGEDVGPLIPQMNLVYGQTAYSVIEFVCRYRGLLVYELPDGTLRLGRASKKRAASGFEEGVNFEDGDAIFSMDERYRAIDVFGQAMNLYAETNPQGWSAAVAEDTDVPRYRNLFVVCESAAPGLDIQQRRADWERSRRLGRSKVLHITTDSWRDKSGALYAPNTQVPVRAPSLRATGDDLWTISEITYRRGDDGTHADVVLMPREAFTVQPVVIQTYETIPLR